MLGWLMTENDDDEPFIGPRNLSDQMRRLVEDLTVRKTDENACIIDQILERAYEEKYRDFYYHFGRSKLTRDLECAAKLHPELNDMVLLVADGKYNSDRWTPTNPVRL